MQARLKICILCVAALPFAGCAAAELDNAERKPVPRTAGAGGDPYDYVPSGYGGGVSQAGKGGASALGGNAGRSGAGAASPAGGMDGATASNAGAAGSPSGLGAGGSRSAAGAAGASSSTSADCPSLTLARVNGTCVPRVTEYDVARKPTSIVLGSDARIWVDDADADELLQLDSSGRVMGRVSCDPGSSPRALIGGAGNTVLWYTDAHAKALVELTAAQQKLVTPLGFEASALALAANGDIFLTEFGKAVYRLNQDQTSLTRWESSPTDAIVSSPDNDVWFSQGSALTRLVPTTGVTDFLLSDTAYASGLCVGSDSGLWFSDGFANQLVRMSWDGTLSRTINLPTGTAPGRIITGPDGAFWFAETGTNKIGRVSLSGEVTHYPLPTPNTLPYALTVGPDGNIWFTAGEHVGRLILDSLP